ncbi:MAG: hypothetical protein KBF88_15540, partial [Polyangiaceae bacterium]|nr:hypothetical protein [Polyangiaceae bacterium]
MSETTAVLRFANHATAIRYVTNLVHLGCNDLEWAETDTAIFLRFRNAPLFPLLTASERNEAECYVESSSGTYAPLGQSASPHDLSSAKDRESLVFLDPKGAFSLQEASFHSVRPEPTLRHVESLRAIERQPPPIHIPLRFVRSAKHAPPSLWALRGSAGRDVTGALADFARSIPEHQHEQIAFAVLEDARFVFLRTLHGSVLDLSLDPAFYELEHSEGIYLPLGWTLSPHLRGPRVEQLAQVETDSLRIFSRLSDSLRVEHGEFSRDGVLLRTVARSAFHPLAEWVDFVVHRAAP